MNTSRGRLILTVLALAVLGLGVSACTQSASRSQTPGSSTATTTTTTAGAKSGSSLSLPSGPATTTSTPTSTSTSTSTSASNSIVAAASSLPACAPEQQWGTGRQVGSTAMSPSALYLTRVGQHPCFDRVVFDLNGPQPVGYTVRYVPVVLADPSGKPVPVAGHAVLQVTVRAPIYGTDDQGHQPWRRAPAIGDSLVAPSQISGWTSLKAVTFAGSFEAQTTIAVGVREQLPFRVLVTSGPYDYQHVVVDIAH